MYKKLITVINLTCLLLLLGAPSHYARALITGSSWGEEIVSLPAGVTQAQNVETDSQGRIYLGTKNQGYWYSDNEGATWSRFTQFRETARVWQQYRDSRNYIYAQISNPPYQPKCIIYRSTDRGATWNSTGENGTVIGKTGDIGLLPNMFWHMTEDSKGNLYTHWYGEQYSSPNYVPCWIYRSTDQGATFTEWYNVSATPPLPKHVHSVIVAPNDWVYVLIGDPNASIGWYAQIRRYNGTAWEVLAFSETSNEPRWTDAFFLGDHIYGLPDLGDYMYRIKYDEPNATWWSSREKIAKTDAFDNQIYDSLRIGAVFFLSTDHGSIIATLDGLHYVKVWQSSTGEITRMQSNPSFPLYFVDQTNYKLYRLNRLEKEDVIYQYCKVFNADRGLTADADNYVLEQRIYNGSTYLDLTNVALSNVQASIIGLSKINWAARDNAGFEMNNLTNWVTSSYGGTVDITNAIDTVHDGTYALKVTKHINDAGSTVLRPSTDITVGRGDYMILAFWYKSNASFTDGIRLVVTNQSGGPSLMIASVSPATIWQRYESVLTFDTSQTWTARISLQFEKPTSSNTEMYVDSVLCTMPESSWQNIRSSYLDQIAFAGEKFNSAFFASDVKTLNPSLTVAGQPVSYSGTLTNGTESPTTSLLGILTGPVKVDASILGSEQAILRIKGTRMILVTNSVLRERTNDGIFVGRYYTNPAITTNTADLIVLTNIEAKITNQSHTSNKLTLTIDSVLGTNSPTLIYVGDMGRPANVSGATTWSYNSEKKIVSINVNTGRREVTLYWMITTISVSSGAQGSSGWFASNENTPITFDGSSSSDNIGVVTYTWDFGDGTTGTSKTTTHTYAKSGNYTVTLTVRDTANNTAVGFITIEVLPPEPFPMWIAAATTVAVIGIAIAIALFRRRRRPPASP